MKWTDKEIRYIQDNYAKHGPKKCAEHLGRSAKAVSHQAGKLNLKREFGYYFTEKYLKEEYTKKGKTITEIANNCDVSETCVSRWLTKRGIKKHKTTKIDLEGQTFGKLFIKKRDINAKEGVWWECLCSCGKTESAETNQLRHRNKKMCRECDKNKRRQNLWNGHEEIPGNYWGKLIRAASCRNLPFEISIQEGWELFSQQNKKCKLSGVTIFFAKSWKEAGTASLDRIDSSKGYLIDNVQWVHKDINFMKQSKTDGDFINWCKLVAKNN
jgi:hypothetical protein